VTARDVPNRVAVTGAAGTVGRPLVRDLVARGHRPRVILRPGSPEPPPPGTEAVHVDLADPAALATHLAGVERLFLLTPLVPRQDLLQIGIVEAARRAGVQHVVKISALNASPDAPTMIQHQHGVVEEALRAAEMTSTSLRPNAFMQNARQWRAEVAARGAVVMPCGDARVSVVDARDVAEAAAVMLTTPEPGDAVHELTGPEALTYTEMARELSAALGRPVRHLDPSPEDLERTMLAGGAPSWLVRARLELYGTYRRGQAARVTTAVRDLTGREPRHFATFAGEIVPLMSVAG